MSSPSAKPIDSFGALQTLEVGDQRYRYFSLPKLA